MSTLINTLYFTWIIGTKDILDAIKNKNMRTNLIIMICMVVFFYWLSILRPFDKDVSVVVYEEGQSDLTMGQKTLNNGTTYSFQAASSLQEMETKLAYQNLGLVLPVDFSQTLDSDNIPTIRGYIFWVDRKKETDLELKYSQAFTEILNQPVEVVIDENIVIPQVNTDGMQTNAAYLLVYFIFTTALTLIPHLMLEEKQTRTLDALLTSPSSPGQVVLGKGLAGLFYILVIGGLGIGLFSAYIVHWGLALAAFLGYAFFAVGLGLAVGSLIKSTKQLGLWTVVLILLLVIPPLFYMESNLKAGIRMFLTYFPTSALASLFRFACSTGVSLAQLLPNLGIVVVSISVVFGMVIWKVRRSDR